MKRSSVNDGVVSAAGGEHRPAGDLGALLADLADTAGDHIVDHLGVDAGALYQCGERVGDQGGRMDSGEGAARSPLAEGSDAGCVTFFALAKEVDALIDGPRGVNLDQRTPTHDENHGATHLTRAFRGTLLEQRHGGASPGHRLNSPPPFARFALAPQLADGSFQPGSCS